MPLYFFELFLVDYLALRRHFIEELNYPLELFCPALSQFLQEIIDWIQPATAQQKQTQTGGAFQQKSPQMGGSVGPDL